MNYRGPYRVRATQKSVPCIEHPCDAIIRVNRACICGSDLHLYHGLVPDTRVVTTFGHEFTGVVEEVGASVEKLKVGDQVLVPFNVFCGACHFCQCELYSNCHNVNPEASAVGAIYGYSHTTGGYDGGQAEYVRVPMADVGPPVILADLDLDDAVLLADSYPTGYQAAEMGDIEEGETVVVFGAGPVGIFAAKSAWLLGAGRVIVVEHVDYRLEFVKNFAQCETVNFKEVDDMALHIKKMTDWMGADVCIDAVGCEAAGNFAPSLTGIKLTLQGGAATVLHWCINSVRKGGKVSIVGVYGPTFNAIPIGNAVYKGLTLRMNLASECQAPPAPADRAHPGRPHQAQRGHHAPHAVRGSGRRVPPVLQQARQLHQDGARAAACNGFNLKEATDMDTLNSPPANTLEKTPEKTPEVPARFAHIRGWGADLDHAMRPAYPMERMPARRLAAHAVAAGFQVEMVTVHRVVVRAQHAVEKPAGASMRIAQHQRFGSRG
ncbi:Threonine dehydrogenase and related Zn-dependent dehydrogenases [Polaromonas sp. CG9_12]|nr:Threonine dehydrogenase and related Zn-dependent dehydrogenases [Polaromonas sp. CG9_12]